MIAQQNKALELSKPDSNAGGRALPLAVSRAIIIEAGFAAQRQRWTDVAHIMRNWC